MANVYLQDSTLTAIGDAIRAKAGNSNLLLPSEMPAAITNLPSGGGGATFAPYVGDKDVFNRLKFTSSKNILYLSDLGLTIDTFRELKCVSGSFVHSRAVSQNIMTSALLSKNRKSSWQIYPSLGKSIQYPDIIIEAVKAKSDSTAELFPMVIAADYDTADTAPYLMGVSGGAWMGLAVAAVFRNANSLQFYTYDYVNKVAATALQYLVYSDSYVYWR